jgi:hypothetical protein
VYTGIDPGDDVAGDAYLRIAGEYARTAHNRTKISASAGSTDVQSNVNINELVSTDGCQITVGESLALTTTGACPTTTATARANARDWISVAIRRLPRVVEQTNSNTTDNINSSTSDVVNSNSVNVSKPTTEQSVDGVVVEIDVSNPSNVSLVITVEVKSILWGDNDDIRMRLPSFSATTTAAATAGTTADTTTATTDTTTAAGTSSQKHRSGSDANTTMYDSSGANASQVNLVSSPLPSLGSSMFRRVAIFRLPPFSTTIVVAVLA